MELRRPSPTASRAPTKAARPAAPRSDGPARPTPPSAGVTLPMINAPHGGSKRNVVWTTPRGEESSAPASPGNGSIRFWNDGELAPTAASDAPHSISGEQLDGGDAEIAFMDQMYSRIQELNVELDREREETRRRALDIEYQVDSRARGPLEVVPRNGGGLTVEESENFGVVGAQAPLTSSYDKNAATVNRKFRPHQPRSTSPPEPSAVLPKDQLELCAALGKNAELRMRSREVERQAEQASIDLEQTQRQMKMAERRIAHREEKLRALLKEKMQWQNELKELRDQVVEEKMRQVDLMRRLETTKRETTAQIDAMAQSLRDSEDENQALREYLVETKSQLAAQTKRLEDFAKQAREERERLTECIVEARSKFREWKDNEAAGLKAQKDQAMTHLKAEYELKIARHQDEKQKLRDKVKDLEVSLRLMQKDRSLSPLELSLRKATILGSKEAAGTTEAELIEATVRIKELEALLEHAQEFQKRQDNIIKVSESTISRLIQEREVAALDKLANQQVPGAQALVSGMVDASLTPFSSSLPVSPRQMAASVRVQPKANSARESGSSTRAVEPSPPARPRPPSDQPFRPVAPPPRMASLTSPARKSEQPSRGPSVVQEESKEKMFVAPPSAKEAQLMEEIATIQVQLNEAMEAQATERERQQSEQKATEKDRQDDVVSASEIIEDQDLPAVAGDSEDAAVTTSRIEDTPPSEDEVPTADGLTGSHDAEKQDSVFNAETRDEGREEQPISNEDDPNQVEVTAEAAEGTPVQQVDSSTVDETESRSSIVNDTSEREDVEESRAVDLQPHEEDASTDQVEDVSMLVKGSAAVEVSEDAHDHIDSDQPSSDIPVEDPTDSSGQTSDSEGEACDQVPVSLSESDQQPNATESETSTLSHSQHSDDAGDTELSTSDDIAVPLVETVELPCEPVPADVEAPVDELLDHSAAITNTSLATAVQEAAFRLIANVERDVIKNLIIIYASMSDKEDDAREVTSDSIGGATDDVLASTESQPDERVLPGVGTIFEASTGSAEQPSAEGEETTAQPSELEQVEAGIDSQMDAVREGEGNATPEAVNVSCENSESDVEPKISDDSTVQVECEPVVVGTAIDSGHSPLMPTLHRIAASVVTIAVAQAVGVISMTLAVAHRRNAAERLVNVVHDAILEVASPRAIDTMHDLVAPSVEERQQVEFDVELASPCDRACDLEPLTAAINSNSGEQIQSSSAQNDTASESTDSHEPTHEEVNATEVDTAALSDEDTEATVGESSVIDVAECSPSDAHSSIHALVQVETTESVEVAEATEPLLQPEGAVTHPVAPAESAADLEMSGVGGLLDDTSASSTTEKTNGEAHQDAATEMMETCDGSSASTSRLVASAYVAGVQGEAMARVLPPHTRSATPTDTKLVDQIHVMAQQSVHQFLQDGIDWMVNAQKLKDAGMTITDIQADENSGDAAEAASVCVPATDDQPLMADQPPSESVEQETAASAVVEVERPVDQSAALLIEIPTEEVEAQNDSSADDSSALPALVSEADATAASSDPPNDVPVPVDSVVVDSDATTADQTSTDAASDAAISELLPDAVVEATVDGELGDTSAPSTDVAADSEVVGDEESSVPIDLRPSTSPENELSSQPLNDSSITSEEANTPSTPVITGAIAPDATASVEPSVTAAPDTLASKAARTTSWLSDAMDDSFLSGLTSVQPSLEHPRTMSERSSLPATKSAPLSPFIDSSRYASSIVREQIRDPTLLAYDVKHEQAQPFAMLDETILQIDQNAKHMQHDENDKVRVSVAVEGKPPSKTLAAIEGVLVTKRKRMEHENHRKSIAYRIIPAFNYEPVLIKFQWSDFVVATPIRLMSSASQLNLLSSLEGRSSGTAADASALKPSPGTGPVIQKISTSPIQKMKLLMKKGVKLPCGTYVIISVFNRPLEDGNENLRIQIYDPENVEEFQYDFHEDHLRDYVEEWTGADDEARAFVARLEFRREQGSIIIKMPDKIRNTTPTVMLEDEASVEPRECNPTPMAQLLSVLAAHETLELPPEPQYRLSPNAPSPTRTPLQSGTSNLPEALSSIRAIPEARIEGEE